MGNAVLGIYSSSNPAAFEGHPNPSLYTYVELIAPSFVPHCAF